MATDELNLPARLLYCYLMQMLGKPAIALDHYWTSPPGMALAPTSAHLLPGAIRVTLARVGVTLGDIEEAMA